MPTEPAATPTATATQLPPVAFPKHDYPLETDRGGYYLAGQLVLKEGCLLVEVPSNSNDTPWPAPLAIWPSSFSLEQDSGTVRVLDGDGQVVARVGDYLRLSWAAVTYDEAKRHELITELPEHCPPGPILVVGEITAFDPKNEATELRLSDPEVLFLRQETVMASERIFLAAAGYGELARQLRAAADDICGGRLALALEGGYDLAALGASVEATLGALCGRPPEAPPDAPLAPPWEAVLEDLRAAHAREWPALRPFSAG